MCSRCSTWTYGSQRDPTSGLDQTGITGGLNGNRGRRIPPLRRAFVRVKHCRGATSIWGTANVGSLMCSCPDATLINRGPNICKPLKRLSLIPESLLFPGDTAREFSAGNARAAN